MAVLIDAHELSARSVSSSLTPNATQRTTLIVAGCYIIIIGILWYTLSLSASPFCTLLSSP
jgi:hypothetical protein